MAMLAGHWIEVPTIRGPKVITLNGVSYGVPDDAQVKVVHASGNLDIAHVRVGRLVYVLSVHGQLVETDLDARSRALPAAWASIAASK